MKKETQIIDARRNVWKQKISYLSILVIAMLAVMAYLGINFASRAIANNGNAFYDETRFRDIEIISTKLLTEDDLGAIRATAGVADAEGVWYTTGKLLSGEDHVSVNVVSLTQRVNVPMLLEGRLPETAGECALEKTIAEELGLQPGDTVSLQSPKGGTAEYLGRSEFTVTGIVYHPDHGCIPLQVPGSREVVVLPEAFDMGENLQGCFMKAELLLDKAAGADRFGKKYLASVQTVTESLEALSAERTVLRDAEIRTMYTEQIDEGQSELDEAAAKLKDARKQLDDGAAEIAENQKKLDDAAKTLEDSLHKLDDGAIELDEAKAVLEQSKLQLDNAALQLAAGKKLLDEKGAELADARATLDDAAQQLAAGKAELDENEARLTDARAQLDAAELELADAKAQLDAAETELAEAEAQIAEGEAKLADAERQLKSGANALSAGQAQLEAGAQQLRDGWSEIEDAKEAVRGILKLALQAALQGKVADPATTVNTIQWADSQYNPDLNNPNLDATWFQLTDQVGFYLPSSDYADAVNAVMTAFHDLYESHLAGTVADENTLAVDYQSLLNNAHSFAGDYATYVGLLQTWNAGHNQYLAGKAALNEGADEYWYGYEAYNEGKEKLEKAKEQYEEGLARFKEGLQQYEEGLAEYEDGKARYEAGLAEFEAGQARYDDALRQYNEGEALYAEGLAQYNDGVAKYESSRNQYYAAYSRYQDGLAQYEAGLAEYNDGVAAYQDALTKYNDGKRQLAEGRETLAEKEAEYADGEKQLAEGEEKLDSARAERDAQDPTRWVIMSAEGNPSYITIRNGTRNVGDMGATFALVFVLVGALVIYATVGRIVDEQRRLVGATKALGLMNSEIAAKYLFFGVSGAVLGVILGTLLGYIGIQPILTMVYGRNYVFGIKKLAFNPGLAAIALVLGIALTSITVWLSCSDLLRSTAISLMQEKAPPTKFRSKGDSKLPLYWRAVLLNMRMDKKRVAVTIVSVAGCCTLLVAGFSMRSSVMDSLKRQFDEAAVYDAKITWEPGANPEAGAQIEEALRSAGADWIALCDKNQVWAVNGTLKSAELLCAPLSELDDYFVRRDPKTGKPLDDADGVWVNKPISNKLGVKAGDEVILYDAVMNPYPARIAGVFNEYAGREMILSQESYAAIFGTAPENNAFLAHWGGADPAALRAQLSAIPGFGAMEEAAQLRATYQSFAGVLNLIAGVLTLIAALMAYFILLNLANMYVNQKKRELTIMRVNGFTVKEVIRYVAGESVATTAIGIVLGLFLGTLLFGRILSLLENESLRFVHSIQWSGWLFGALITTAFSVAIYAVALRKVKYLKLTDVA